MNQSVGDLASFWYKLIYVVDDNIQQFQSNPQSYKNPSHFLLFDY